MRLHAFEHAVEIVRSDLCKFAVFEPGHGLRRLSGEVAQDAHHEGELLLDDGAFGFHLIGNVYARLADALGTVERSAGEKAGR